MNIQENTVICDTENLILGDFFGLFQTSCRFYVENPISLCMLFKDELLRLKVSCDDQDK